MHTPPTSDATPAPPKPLFFADRLPDVASESAAEAESRVLLELETTSPLPAEKLAYGWVRLPSRDLLYYAAPRERVPAHDAFATPGAVLPEPDAVLLPDGVSADDFRAASRDLYADLRPRAELLLLRERAAADRLLTRVAPALKFGALAGIALLLVGGGLAAERALKENALRASATALKTARENLTLLDTLDRFDAPARSVLDALALVNPHRPEPVAFTRVTFSDNRELALEGRSGEASAVNRFADSLRSAGLFAGVEVLKLETSGGRTTFRMRLSVTKWPKFADAPTPAEAAPASGSPSNTPVNKDAA